MALYYSIALMTIYLRTSIVAYRVFMIKAPVHFLTRVKRKHLKYSLAFMWSTSLFVYGFLSFAWPAITGSRLVDYTNACFMEYYFSIKMTTFMYFFNFVVPLTILVILSIVLYLLIRRLSVRVGISNRPMVQQMQPCPAQNACSGMSQHKEMKQTLVGTTTTRGLTDQPTTSSTKRDSNENWETGKHVSLQLKVPSDVITKELPSGHGSTNPNPATQPGLNKHNAPDDASTGLAPAEAGPGTRGVGTRPPVVGVQRGGMAPDPQKRHRKAAIRIFIIVAVYLVSWLPIAIISLIFMICPFCVSGSNAYFATLNILWISSLVNPVLYMLLNASIRRGIIRLLRLPQRWL